MAKIVKKLSAADVGKPGTLLWVHLGCGDKRLPGFVHVDARKDAEPDFIACANDLPFDDNSAGLIYWSHGLEHVGYNNVSATLAELRRVLVPGGILRLSVPNFKAIAELYLYDDVHLERLSGLLHGGQTYADNFHYSAWDYETLASALRKAKFYGTRPYEPEKVNPSGYYDYSYATITTAYGGVRSISVNVEAIK